jgi:agmatinase
MLKRSDLTNDQGIWAGLNDPDRPIDDADIVVFGVPFDEGVSYRAGAKEAPRVLRENTYTIAPTTEYFEPIDSLRILDMGDYVVENRALLFEEIEEMVSALVSMNKFFTVIGGDHSITIPIERGVNAAVEESFGIIHIDAHFDLCDTLDGDKLSHGCVQRRALELEHVDDTDNIYFVGIRSVEMDELEFINNNQINVANASDCHRQGIDQIATNVIEKMDQFEKVYVTIDIDGLDPAYAPGTGTPQFGGLYSRQLLDLLKALMENLPIVGFDVVEVAPTLDPSLTSMFAARKIITEMWGHYLRKNK